MLKVRQENIAALHSLIPVVETAKYVSCGYGVGSINVTDYYTTLAKELAEFERFEKIVSVLQPLFDAGQ